MPLFELTTAETLTRTYQVEADDEHDARRRFEQRNTERQVLTNTSSYYITSTSIDAEKREEKFVAVRPLDVNTEDIVEFLYDASREKGAV